MSEGYRFQWRKMWKNPIFYGNANLIALWIWILDHAEWREKNGKKVTFHGKSCTLAFGEVSISSRQLAKILGVPSSTLHRLLNLLKNETMIETRTDCQSMLILVKNFKSYQKNETRNETRVGHEWDTSGTRSKIDGLQKPKTNSLISKEVKNIKKGESPQVVSQQLSSSVDHVTAHEPFDPIDRFLALFRSVLPLQFGLDGSEANNLKYARLSVEKYVDLVAAANPDFSTSEVFSRAFEIIEYTLEKAAKSKRWCSRITSTQNFYQDSFQIFNPQSYGSS